MDRSIIFLYFCTKNLNRLYKRHLRPE